MLKEKNIDVAIGRQSSGDEYFVNLARLPNLFISQSIDAQLPSIFVSLAQQLTNGNADMLFALSASSRNSVLIMPEIPEERLLMSFTHNSSAADTINSIQQFVDALNAEMKARRSLSRTKVAATGSTALVIFIDDIFEIIAFSGKKLALSFLELLVSASAWKMYFVVGSSGIYRGLLEQLIYVSPRLQKKLGKSLIERKLTQPLGAELVLNPDDLLFFRARGEREYMRLYPY